MMRNNVSAEPLTGSEMSVFAFFCDNTNNLGDPELLKVVDVEVLRSAITKAGVIVDEHYRLTCPPKAERTQAEPE